MTLGLLSLFGYCVDVYDVRFSWIEFLKLNLCFCITFELIMKWETENKWVHLEYQSFWILMFFLVRGTHVMWKKPTSWGTAHPVCLKLAQARPLESRFVSARARQAGLVWSKAGAPVGWCNTVVKAVDSVSSLGIGRRMKYISACKVL